MATRSVAHYMKDSHRNYGATLARVGQWDARAARTVYPATPTNIRVSRVAPLLAFLVTMVADIVTTVAGIRSGITHEGDPLAAWVISHFGLMALTLPLILVTGLGLFGLHLAKLKGWRVLATSILAVLWAAAVIHGMAAISNAEILHAAGMFI